MITEDYVSFETAKLLKEKGFDCPCKVWYAEYTSVWGGDPSGDRKYINIQFDDKNRFDEYYKFLCYAPTLQMAMKWLRNTFHLEIYPYHNYDNSKWWYEIIKYPNSVAEYECGKDEELNTYEEACENAIKYCLEKLINNDKK